MVWLLCVLLCTTFYGGEASDEQKDKGSKTMWDTIEHSMVNAVDSKEGVNCPKADDLVCPRPEVTFWLYTRGTRKNPLQLDPTDRSRRKASSFVKGAPLKVLIHGYTMDKDKAINEVLRPEYFSRGDINIISVDWSPLCREHCYREAAQSVPTVGHCIALMVSSLLADYHDVFSDVHVLGHSLGAHVAAWASTELDLPRLTEFDPALPLFTNGASLLKKGKAAVVDVWHSNANIKGRDSPDGTVDIYFNDQTDQPGCKCDSSCSHLRAVEYYGETISGRRALTAFPCPGGWPQYRDGNCKKPSQRELARFGEHMSPGVTGVYLAFTRSKKPFIIRAIEYMREKLFKRFRKSTEECPQHRFISYIANLFGV